MIEIRNSSGTPIASHISLDELERLIKSGLVRTDDQIIDENTKERLN